MKSIISLAILFFLTINFSRSQELNCDVQVVAALAESVSSDDKATFDELKKRAYEFMNNRKWTADVFQTAERIECSLVINVTKKISSEEWEASVQVQSKRPIHNSSYNSVVLNFIDNDFHFKFSKSLPFEFNENSFISNLTSVLAFYAYYIIGLDYDTYSLKGGSTYFQKAQQIVNNAQSSNEEGWKAYNSNNKSVFKNRYWLLENILNGAFDPAREFLYEYHRLALDLMADNMEEGIKVMQESLNLLQTVHEQKPNSLLMQTLVGAKSDELIKTFSKATPDVKASVATLLKRIDSPNAAKYQAILTSRP
jgi:hypothetical protein